MCSLNQKVSPNCSPENLKTNSEFTERELFLIENRSGFTVQTLCKNHERKYLTFYIQKQTTCCDPLNKHCDEKKPTRYVSSVSSMNRTFTAFIHEFWRATKSAPHVVKSSKRPVPLAPRKRPAPLPRRKSPAPVNQCQGNLNPLVWILMLILILWFWWTKLTTA